MWHVLSTWHVLTVAVQNQWGGPDSADKRDFLAGAVSGLFAERPDTDALDVVEVLLQFMLDDFGVNVEDDSEEEVARRIVQIRQETGEGDFAAVDAMQRQWEERRGRDMATGKVVVSEVDQDADFDSVDEEEESDSDDVEMSDVQAQRPAREKVVPEVDEEGFTKVIGKKKK